jgi:hypothetical protein
VPLSEKESKYETNRRERLSLTTRIV